MADAEEKAKAEKLAAAKKKVEEMKKKKAKKTSAPTKKDDKPDEGTKAVNDDSKSNDASKKEVDAPAAIESANDSKAVEESVLDMNEPLSEPPVAPPVSRHRAPSLSASSKMRSASFRQASGEKATQSAILSPEVDSAPDIYRKQTSRIEELEKENKNLTSQVAEGERRWRKAEESLEDLREGEISSVPEASGGAVTNADEIARLNAEIASLQRQNAQITARSRHGSSPSLSSHVLPSDLTTALASKTSTIEAMEIELSTLRAQVARISSGSSAEKEQISALEDKLRRSERAAELSATELGDLKRNLERTTEKAVREGSEKMSAETRVRTLEQEVATLAKDSEDAEKRAEALEKKVLALTGLHKESDARTQVTKREIDGLKTTVSKLQVEKEQLSEERERAKRKSINEDDEGVDALEDEDRAKLSRRIRELEGEVHSLRRGAYDRERRNLADGDGSFTDIDLRGSSYPNGYGARRKSAHGGGKGIGDLLTSGFHAITGASANAEEGLLNDGALDDFDESAFRLAQEEEAKRRLERVKEVKRGLKTWEGWRMDLLEERRGGDQAFGEIFEI